LNSLSQGPALDSHNMQYVKISGLFFAAYLLNLVAPAVLAWIDSFVETEAAIASTLWCLSLFLGFGWACSYVAEGTIFPNFALQLIVGILLHDALAPVAHQIILAVVVCTSLAAIILKCGGDDIERSTFAKVALPVFMIAIPGYLLTFLAMFVLLVALGIDGKTAALLSAIIGSTDPASLIPTLKKLTFKTEYRRLEDLAVAESALNDGVGAIFTAAVAAMILAGSNIASIDELVTGLMNSDNLLHLGRQFLFGTLAGVAGWVAMRGYENYRLKIHMLSIQENSYDFAVVLAIPLATFFLAQIIGGNGFLAAFISGLLANYGHGKEYFHGTLRAMEVKIESIAKPIIFMMVGPFVSLTELGDSALLGFAVSLLFMVLARPLAVMISLGPTRVTMREKLFMSAVRETGVIPVVLSVITAAQFPQLSLLMPLTAWVVIWTLVILPAITPWWAKKVGVTV
jgi:NhaP-type Na+/H+ or K+/H+ antiporter